MRWPFGPPHLTLKPSPKQQKHKKQNKSQKKTNTETKKQHETTTRTQKLTMIYYTTTRKNKKNWQMKSKNLINLQKHCGFFNHHQSACQTKPFYTKNSVFTTRSKNCFVVLRQKTDSCRKIVVSMVVLFCLSCETTMRTIFVQFVKPKKKGTKTAIFQ